MLIVVYEKSNLKKSTNIDVQRKTQDSTYELLDG